MSNLRFLIPMTLSAILLAATAPPAHATSYEKCGNGTVNQGEQCDDGNTTSGDGCQSNCRIQDGYECTGTPSVCAPEVPTADCGNQVVDAGEQCDGGSCCTSECTFTAHSTTCRGAAGVCDAAEKCTGSSATCPADQLKPSTTICRAAVPDCEDTPEFCTGTSVDCPPGAGPACGNGVVESGEGCDDGNTTNGDGCQSNCMVQDGYECTGSPSICAPEAEVDCGDNVVDEGEDCDGGACCTSECTFKTSTDTCRASTGPCDPAEKCTGSTSTCPTNTFTPSTTVCRGAAGVCDAAEKCTGSSGTCPADQLKPSTTICRAAVPDCEDEPEFCTGTSVNCPPAAGPACGNGVVETGEGCDDGNTTNGDGCQSNCMVQDGYECTGSPSVCAPEAEVDCGDNVVDEGEDCDGGPCCTSECTFKTSTNTCRASTGTCDPAEKCTGSTSTCPTNTFTPSTTVCRGATDVCDATERCTGSSGTCPADTFKPSTTMCSDDEFCTGSSPTCPDTGGAEACGDGILDEGEECDSSACCTSECTLDDECVANNEICRSPGFWSHRGSLIDDILEQTGPLQICGETIDSGTDLGVISSTIEALCVSTRGVTERSLFRQLVAAALNCAVSEGDTCDEILSRFIDVSFTECSAICASGSGETSECIEQLDCFNNGGQIINGECAFGTCEDDPTAYCGGDFGSCDDAAGDDDLQDGDDDQGKYHKGNLTHDVARTIGADDEADDENCIRFEDSCAGEQLCNIDTDASAQICPSRTRVAHSSLCKEARKNECTIDSCD